MRTWLKSATARSGSAVGHHEPSPPCGERVGRGGVDSEPDVLARPQLASDLTARTPTPTPPPCGEGLILTGWLGHAAPLVALALSACAGFQPLYGEATTRSLASIEVIAPDGRTGYLMRQHLDDAFAKDHSVVPTYLMDLSIGEARYPRGVRIDNVATRYEYVLTATYQLKLRATGAAVRRGQVRVELTYDSADQPYASISAQQDAQDRAATEAARRIELELATWLATGTKG